MRIDVSEGVPPESWADLPTDDRIMVGGHTVWVGPFHTPVVVAQPNRWGVIEGSFPDLPCLVEADPPVTGHLPLPDEVVGFLDRAHRTVGPPDKSDSGRELLRRGARLAKRIAQIRGVRLAASPFARTIPLLTPRDPATLMSDCATDGLVGLRPLAGTGGGVALSVREEHGPDELDQIVAVFAHHILR